MPLASFHLLKVGSGRIEAKASPTSCSQLSRILFHTGCEGDSELVLPEGGLPVLKPGVAQTPGTGWHVFSIPSQNTHTVKTKPRNRSACF